MLVPSPRPKRAKYEVVVREVGARPHDRPLLRDDIRSCEGCPCCNQMIRRCLASKTSFPVDYNRIPVSCPLGMGGEEE